MNFEFELIQSIPAELNRPSRNTKGGGKWQPLRDRIQSLTPDQPAIRVKFESKFIASCARSAIGGSKGIGRPKVAVVEGYRLVARTAPVNGNVDGPWYLYAAIIPIQQS